MRVLQVMAGAKAGGAETFFVDLVGALHRAGLEQRAIIRHHPDRAEKLRSEGLFVKELPFQRWLDRTTRVELRKQIEEFRPHIVQTWMGRATELCPSGSFVHIGWLGGYYDIKYFRKCHELVGVTRDLVNHVITSGWPKDRSHYLPTLSFNAPMPPIPRAEFDTPEDVPLIMALGRLHPVKGFDVLLKAMAEIPGAYLWLAGEGPLRKELEAQTRALGLSPRVRFLGWRNDRAALFASCDMCVMPSREEPFGTVMIEAWAYHRPIIAAAAKGPAALIRNGENGLLVPIDDVSALTEAINRLIAQPELSRKIVDRAWLEYQEHYTETKVVEQYLAFYESLLGKASSACAV